LISAILVWELINRDSSEFHTMFKMYMIAFEELLIMVAPLIAKENTLMTSFIVD